MKLSSHSDMKASNIPWMGSIPAHWDVKTIKRIFIERNEKNDPIKTDFILSLTIERGVIPYTERGGGGNKSKEDLTGYKLAYPNDIVLNSMNIIAGSVGLSKYFGAVSPVYYMLYVRNEHDDVRFFSRVFELKTFQKSLLGLGNGILMKESESSDKLNTIRMRIPIDKLNSQYLPYPPIDEQRSIANFLNVEIQKIDQLVEEQKKFSDLLKEKRQVVISQAVTKGVNKKVPMKNSGIDWFGEIPQHWDVVPLKFGFELQKRPPPADSGTVTAFRDGQVTLRSNRRTEGFTEALQEIGYQGIEVEDLVIHAMDAFAGAIGVSDSRGKSSPVYSVCKAKSGYLPKFYGLFLRHMSLTGYIESLSKGIRERSTDFRWSDAKNVPIPRPPEAEQVEILNYLDSEISKIDSLLKEQEKQIELLNERRVSLISAAVTGKIDVRKLDSRETS